MADRDGRETSDPSGDAPRRAAAGVPVDAASEQHPPPDPASDESPTPGPPTVVALAGRAGVVLAVGSLGLAVLGVGGFALGLQPYGALATVLALAGVSVAMVLGMAHQAYAGDWVGE